MSYYDLYLKMLEAWNKLDEIPRFHQLKMYFSGNTEHGLTEDQVNNADTWGDALDELEAMALARSPHGRTLFPYFGGLPVPKLVGLLGIPENLITEKTKEFFDEIGGLDQSDEDLAPKVFKAGGSLLNAEFYLYKLVDDRFFDLQGIGAVTDWGKLFDGVVRVMALRTTLEMYHVPWWSPDLVSKSNISTAICNLTVYDRRLETDDMDRIIPLVVNSTPYNEFYGVKGEG